MRRSVTTSATAGIFAQNPAHSSIRYQFRAPITSPVHDPLRESIPRAASKSEKILRQWKNDNRQKVGNGIAVAVTHQLSL
jgi:hypothetical protein